MNVESNILLTEELWVYRKVRRSLIVFATLILLYHIKPCISLLAHVRNLVIIYEVRGTAKQSADEDS